MYNFSQPQMNMMGMGYNNPYDMSQRYSQPQQVSQPNNSLIRVTGIDGAKAYQMNANSTVALFDCNEDLFYVKTTDGAGFPTIRTFKFEEVTNFPKNSENVANTEDFITKDEFETFKREVADYVEQFIQQQTIAKTAKSEPISPINAVGKQYPAEQPRANV